MNIVIIICERDYEKRIYNCDYGCEKVSLNKQTLNFINMCYHHFCTEDKYFRYAGRATIVPPRYLI